MTTYQCVCGFVWMFGELCRDVDLRVCVCVSFCVCGCVHVCVDVYLCVCMCTCVCGCLPVCVDVYLCVWMSHVFATTCVQRCEPVVSTWIGHTPLCTWHSCPHSQCLWHQQQRIFLLIITIVLTIMDVLTLFAFDQTSLQPRCSSRGCIACR